MTDKSRTRKGPPALSMREKVRARVAQSVSQNETKLRRQVLARLDAAAAKLESIRVFHGANSPLVCPDPECSVCAVLDCPYHEPLHYHHDDCPSCHTASEKQP